MAIPHPTGSIKTAKVYYYFLTSPEWEYLAE